MDLSGNLFTKNNMMWPFTTLNTRNETNDYTGHWSFDRSMTARPLTTDLAELTLLTANKTNIRVSFLQRNSIRNNSNIRIRGFTTWKQKFQWQNVTSSEDQTRDLWLTSDSKSHTLLSELIWLVLLMGSLNFCSYTAWFLDFQAVSI